MKGFWNGEPCEVEIVEVIVGESPKPTWWCADLVGQKRMAIKIIQNDQVFYIDNDKQGFEKITLGRGSPKMGHSSLPVEREI